MDETLINILNELDEDMWHDQNHYYSDYKIISNLIRDSDFTALKFGIGVAEMLITQLTMIVESSVIVNEERKVRVQDNFEKIIDYLESVKLIIDM